MRMRKLNIGRMMAIMALGAAFSKEGGSALQEANGATGASLRVSKKVFWGSPEYHPTRSQKAKRKRMLAHLKRQK